MVQSDLLEGKYPLRDEFCNPVPPENFLGLFRDKDFYDDVRKFVRSVDNDTGIPFLGKEEYEMARRVFPPSVFEVYEGGGFISMSSEKVYLRGWRYYINHLDKDGDEGRSRAEFALDLLRTNLEQYGRR